MSKTNRSLRASAIAVAEHKKLGIGITLECATILDGWLQRALQQDLILRNAIADVLNDVECYCADNVACKAPCPRCVLAAMLETENKPLLKDL